jgi:hypothetical protein
MVVGVCVVVQGWLGLFTGGLWGVCGELRESREGQGHPSFPNIVQDRSQNLCSAGTFARG